MVCIPVVFRAMAENGSTLPEFQTDETRSFFSCRLPVHPKAHDGAHDGVHDQAHDALSPIAIHLLNALRDTPLSTPELLEVLGYTSRSKSFRNALKQVLYAEFIEMTLPDKPRSKHQKYRLTREGQARLDQEAKS